MSTTQAKQWATELVSLVKKLTPKNFDELFYSSVLPLATSLREYSPADSVEMLNYVLFCIPLWEATHWHTSGFGSLSQAPKQRALVIQLLTFVYDNFLDRRCNYLGHYLWAPEFSTTTPTCNPEITIPLDAEWLVSVAAAGDDGAITGMEGFSTLAREYLDVAQFCYHPWKYDEELLKGTPGSVQVLLRGVATKLTNVLKKAKIVSSFDKNSATRSEQHILFATHIDRNDHDRWLALFSATTLRRVLFRVMIILCRNSFTDEQKMIAAATSSEWMKKTIDGSANLTYSSFFGDIFDVINILASLKFAPTRVMPPPSAAAAKEQPAPLPPFKWAAFSAVVRDAIVKGRGQPTAERHHNPFSPIVNSALKRSSQLDVVEDEGDEAPVTQISVKELAAIHSETVTDGIAAEVQFDGKSSTLQDCDQLTRFLRRELLLPRCPGGISLLPHFALSRKRGRDQEKPEGRVLLPRGTSLTEVLSEGGAKHQLPQERIVLQLLSPS